MKMLFKALNFNVHVQIINLQIQLDREKVRLLTKKLRLAILRDRLSLYEPYSRYSKTDIKTQIKVSLLEIEIFEHSIIEVTHDIEHAYSRLIII